MDEDFTKQLQQEKLAQIKEENQQTYTDKDGTVYEWDEEKKAWFPKIDEDFIANYQLNYGNNCQTSEENSDKTEEKSEKSTEYDPAAYEKYCRDYYNYYGYEYKGDEAASSSNDDSKSNINPTTGQPFKDHAEYYAYYYGEEYAEYYKNFEDDQVSTPGSNNIAKKKTNKKELKKQQAGEKRKMPPEQEPATWFKYEAEEGTHVYVSGLSSSITEEEFQELMSKYGLIMFDPHNKKPKLKLYKDSEGNMKGDGLCCYIKKESVDLALKLLDGLEYNGSKISVEKAQFEMKGEFDPTKKKKKLSNKQKRKMKESQEKLFEWKLDKPTDVRLKQERIVILKNMFDPKEFETDPLLINELREDVRTECSKFGDVRKITLYDRNVEGIISVIFKTPEEADVCIEALHGRWFAKKQIHAETYDGKTRYEVEETEEEKAERIKTWNKFLEGEASANSDSKNSTKPAASADDAVEDSNIVTVSSTASTSVKTDVEMNPQESTSDSVTSTMDSHATTGTDTGDHENNSNVPTSEIISSTDTPGSPDSQK